MRGSVFYDTSRFAAMESDKNYLRHKNELKKIVAGKSHSQRKSFEKHLMNKPIY